MLEQINYYLECVWKIFLFVPAVFLTILALMLFVAVGCAILLWLKKEVDDFRLARLKFKKEKELISKEDFHMGH